MSEEELIETLKAFEEKRVEQLPESARNLFYAIMKIADERDEYKQEVERLNNIIKEAIEHINKNWGHWCSNHCKYATETINILKGSDDE